jgi:hypothetical protein
MIIVHGQFMGMKNRVRAKALHGRHQTQAEVLKFELTTNSIQSSEIYPSI